MFFPLYQIKDEKCHESLQQRKLPFGFISGCFQIRIVMEASPLSSSPLLIQSSSKGTEEDLVLEEDLVPQVVLGINRINFLDMIFPEQILPLFSGGKLWHAICLGLSFSKNNGNLPLGRCYSPPSAIH